MWDWSQVRWDRPHPSSLVMTKDWGPRSMPLSYASPVDGFQMGKSGVKSGSAEEGVGRLGKGLEG